MSKKQLLKDNLLMFVGGNIANALNYLLNIVLFRLDNHLFNLYSAYTSLSLLLMIPSLVTLRLFTVYGNPVIANIRNVLVRYKDKGLLAVIIIALLLIPTNILLISVTEDGTVITSTLLIIVAIMGFLGNIFRGIRQHEEDYTRAVISLNLEAAGRLVLGFLFAVVLNMGISGILIGHVLGLTASLVICFDWTYVKKGLEINSDIRLRNLFSSTFLMTSGLEFFSNFDIVYSNNLLKDNNTAQTEFNALQFFRKIIFFGIFTVSSTILSLGGKNRHSKKFMFIFTMLTGFTIGIGSSIFFYIFKDFILGILSFKLALINDSQLILFLLFTTLMSTSYLLCNWLFSTKRSIYIYIPVVASTFQALVFVAIGKDLQSLLNSFYISSSAFFVITLTASIIEVYRHDAIDTQDALLTH